jgi:hypothetical protein
MSDERSGGVSRSADCACSSVVGAGVWVSKGQVPQRSG